ncbi:MAG: hypothetical protein K2X27_01495 [Candidatus Obscuribacterales bacterium]|nr:hypothetical protein [Candidatus Obscuribacterales bacterium]
MGIITQLMVESIPTGKKRCEYPATLITDNATLIPDLMPSNVASLLAIVTETRFDESVVPILYTAPNEDAWLFRIPDEIVGYMDKANAKELKGLARKWRKVDPTIKLHYDLAAMDMLFNKIKEFSTLSIQARKPLLVRVML